LRLRKFRVQAFRCIHDSGDIVVGDLAAFIGRNESGKTTILQALTMLNRDEMISELDLCDEMTERLKSEIRIVEGDFELNYDETEIIKEKFPSLHLTKLKIFRSNKNPEIQYDFGDTHVSKEEHQNLEHWQDITKQLLSFVESIPNYISKKLDTDFFTGSMPGNKKIIQAIKVKKKEDINLYKEYIGIADEFLFDSSSMEKSSVFDWRYLKNIEINEWFLAGGINIDNLEKVSKISKKIDISSSLEDNPGIKSSKKVSDFLLKVKKL